MPKKVIIFMSVMAVFTVAAMTALSIFVVGVLGANPFHKWQAERDYKNNSEVFLQVALSSEEIFSISKENFDENSEELCKIFNEMDYEFITFTYDGVFFCKGYDGMSGVGLYYTREGKTHNPTRKEKIIKKLDENWMIFSEHYL